MKKLSDFSLNSQLSVVAIHELPKPTPIKDDTIKFWTIIVTQLET